MMMDLSAEWHIGDAITVMRTLPDASVDLVLTSPPFLALRSYLPADHPDKATELGSEATPGAFVDALLDVIVECRRVLTPYGSLVVELGDTYSGSGGAGGDYNPDGLRDGQDKFVGSARRGGGWPLAKSLTMIPELVRVSLAYGVNPLTGRTVERWRVRNVIRWVRPNPPVGALGDKFRPGTSDMLVACVAKDRFFDLDAVRVLRPGMPTVNGGAFHDHSNDDQMGRNQGTKPVGGGVQNPNGAPPLDWWNIPTQGFKGSHYATWPKNLLVKPILTMCPEKVCVTCGEPSRRITNVSYTAHGDPEKQNAEPAASADYFRQQRNQNSAGMKLGRASKHVDTVGWSDCGHDDWRRGVVLDPFAGSGTTLEVATGYGRSCIGIDLDERNAVLAERRVGMFLRVQ